MPVIQHFFGRYRLEIGGLIIGWLGILMQLFTIIVIVELDFLYFHFGCLLPGIVFLAISLIQIFACLLVLIGIAKNKPKLIIPWLIVKFHVYSVGILFGIYGLVKVFKLVDLTTIDRSMLFTTLTILFIIFVAFCIYSWLAMFTLYHRSHLARVQHFHIIRMELLRESCDNLPYRTMQI